MVEPNFERGFSLQEALEMAYGEDVSAIYIEPPNAGVLTDEDSGEEDGGGFIDNLSGSQLRAAAEIQLGNNDRIGGSYTQDDIIETQADDDTPHFTAVPTTSLIENPSDIDILPSTSASVSSRASNSKSQHQTSKRQAKTANLQSSEGKPQPPEIKKKKESEKFVWIQGDLQESPIPGSSFGKKAYTKYKDLSPVDLFQMFMDRDIMELLVEETSRYALFQNCSDPKVSTAEMKVYLAILILSGYNQLPGKRFYWDLNSDMRNNLVHNSMRRDRFLQISRFLHFADNNNPDLSDKIWKMRPLMDKVKNNCLRYFEPEEHLCYDESMVKYFGRHSCKQFIRGKPIRFGYKMWCLNNPSGYLINFEMYQGMNPRRSVPYENAYGKSSAPLVTMLDELVQAKGPQPYKLYFDNLFTSMGLLKHLKEIGCQGTGTIRDNRTPNSLPLTGKKALQKKQRGTYESILDKNGGILLVRWVDNGVVTVASTCFGVQPIGSVRRYSQAEKKNVQVPRPYVISKYNSFMGGTDLMDENISCYRISLRGKKWWWCLFTWTVDVCIHNAWQIHKKSGGTLPQLEFRRQIVTTYLKSYGTEPKGAGRTSTSSSSVTLNRVSDDLRYDGREHLVIRIPENKRRRCAGEGCTSVGRTMCKKCNVGLCIECFFIFHKK